MNQQKQSLGYLHQSIEEWMKQVMINEDPKDKHDLSRQLNLLEEKLEELLNEAEKSERGITHARLMRDYEILSYKKRELGFIEQNKEAPLRIKRYKTWYVREGR